MSKPVNGIPGNNEWGKLRSFLGDEMDQEDINAAIGTGVDGRTRGEITNELRAYFFAMASSLLDVLKAVEP